jgi:acetyltransferase-like isoleucine patch superfamily enzyme
MKNNNSTGKISRSILISIITFIIYSLSLYPMMAGIYLVFLFIRFNQIWHFFLLPFLIYIGIITTLFFLVLISGVFIYIFKIKYEPGIYEYNYKNKMAFRWVLICFLYTPIRKIFEIFLIGKIKNWYYKMLGMKIGNNSLVGGTIIDPCLTEIGNNCTMGLFAVIYGHIHDYEKGLIIMDKVKIGDNCVIGAGSIIMPGAILENNVKLATGSVVKKDQVLKKGKVYGGIPAKKIKIKKSQK